MTTSTSMLCPDLCSGQSRRSLYERSPKLIQDYSTTSPRQHSEVPTLLRTSTGRSTKSFGSCVGSSATLCADTSRLRRYSVGRTPGGTSGRVECLRFYQGAIGRTILGDTTGFSSTFFEPYCEVTTNPASKRVGCWCIALYITAGGFSWRSGLVSIQTVGDS